MAVRKDQFANLLEISLTMSSANSLTFEEVNVGLNLFDKIGLNIHRVEYEPTTAAVNEMTTSGDQMRFALTSSSDITNIGSGNVEVLDRARILRHDGGTAGTMVLNDFLPVNDYTSMPSGGLLIPPKPLYLAMNTSGLASPAEVTCRIYFTIIELQDAQYLELLQTRRAFG